MGFKFLVLLAGFAGLQVMAAEKYEAVYAAYDKDAKKVCELRVIKATVGAKWEQTTFEVETGYKHGKETPGTFALALDATDKNQTLFVGESEEDHGSKLLLRLREKDATKPYSYTLKWAHGTHAHTFNCKGAKSKMGDEGLQKVD